MSNSISVRHKSSLLVAITASIGFFIYNILLISNGHFHEDAYILH